MGCCGSNNTASPTATNEDAIIEERVKTLGLYKIAASDLLRKLGNPQNDANLLPLLSSILDDFKLPNKLSHSFSPEYTFYKSLLTSPAKLKIAFALFGKVPTKIEKTKLIFDALKNSSDTLGHQELEMLYKYVGEIAADEMFFGRTAKEDMIKIKNLALGISYASDVLSSVNADGILGSSTGIDCKKFIEDVTNRYKELVSTSEMRKKMIPATREIGFLPATHRNLDGQAENSSNVNSSKAGQINKINPELATSSMESPKEVKPIDNNSKKDEKNISNQQHDLIKKSKETPLNKGAEVSINPDKTNSASTQSQIPPVIEENYKDTAEPATEDSQTDLSEYKCTLGHTLRHEKSKSPHSCDVCSNETSLPHYRCDDCNTFICQFCAEFLAIPEDTVPLTCKESHTLKKVNVYDFYRSVNGDEFENPLCIVCEGWILAEDGPCYHCRRCGMEVCHSCYKNFEDENSASKVCNSCSKRRIWTPVFQEKKFQCDSCNLKRKYIGYFYCDGCDSKICLKSH